MNGPIPIHDGNGNGKMGIMATGCGVHIVMATAMEKIEFFSPVRCRYRHSVNEPLE